MSSEDLYLISGVEYLRHTADSELMHYGVKGMKWGRRKGPSFTTRRLERKFDRTSRSRIHPYKNESLAATEAQLRVSRLKDKRRAAGKLSKYDRYQLREGTVEAKRRAAIRDNKRRKYRKAALGTAAVASAYALSSPRGRKALSTLSRSTLKYGTKATVAGSKGAAKASRAVVRGQVKAGVSVYRAAKNHRPKPRPIRRRKKVVE